jgi:hypothetical protein
MAPGRCFPTVFASRAKNNTPTHAQIHSIEAGIRGKTEGGKHNAAGAPCLKKMRPTKKKYELLGHSNQFVTMSCPHKNALIGAAAAAAGAAVCMLVDYFQKQHAEQKKAAADNV